MYMFQHQTHLFVNVKLFVHRALSARAGVGWGEDEGAPLAVVFFGTLAGTIQALFLTDFIVNKTTDDYFI